MDKVKNTSVNIGNENLDKLRRVFPQFIKENKIDFDALKKFFEDQAIVAGDEKYGLNWAGKSNAFKLIRTPSVGTLIPQEKESKDWDKTENLFIEGDNLEVLKLLQKHYREKIKMIYIDPPYNTGKDFIYKDNYSENISDYYEKTGQSKNGIKMTSNPESAGRYHSDWLTMMYPRLFLARNLLKEDGVIFISIDDNEIANLRLIMDEIFGEDNLVGQIVRATGTSTGQDAKKLGSSLDYCLVYRKSDYFIPKGLQLTEKDKKRFKYDDNDGKGKYALLQLRKTGSGDRKEDRENMFYPVKAPKGANVYPFGPSGYLSRWRVEKKKYDQFNKDNIIVWLTKELDNDFDLDEFENVEENLIEESSINNGKNDTKKYEKSKWVPYVKYYLKNRTKRPSNLWADIEGNKKGSLALKDLFEAKVFDNPKPLEFIKRVIQISCDANSIVLDFFAGSGTTAHAVMELNSEDGGNRKWICVQLPEATDEESEAYKAGYKNIAEIAKERIKRAAKKISKGDIDFKSLTLSKSNYRQWNLLTDKDDEKKLKEQMKIFLEKPLVDSYDEKSVVYEILLKEGYDLNSKMRQEKNENIKYWEVVDEAKKLLVTFEKKITKDQVESLKLTEEDTFVCFDSALDDTTKINIGRNLNVRVI